MMISSYVEELQQNPLLTSHEKYVQFCEKYRKEFDPELKSTPLFAAIIVGDHLFVEILIKEGLDPNERNASGNTPLMFALWKDEYAIVKVLLDNGANPNAYVAIKEYSEKAKIKGPLTALHYCICFGKQQTALSLIRNYNADVNIPCLSWLKGDRERISLPYRVNALLLAFRSVIVDKPLLDLLESKTNFERLKPDPTFLFVSVLDNGREFEYFMTRKGNDIGWAWNMLPLGHIYNAFHSLCMSNRPGLIQSIQLAIQMGADPRIRSLNGDSVVTNMLTHHNMQDGSMEYLLRLPEYDLWKMNLMGEKSILELMLEGQSKTTYYMDYLVMPYSDLIKFLLEKFGKLNKYKNFYKHPLYHFLRRPGDFQYIEYMWDNKLFTLEDVNNIVVTKTGENPLHLTCGYKNETATRFFIYVVGMDPLKRANDGYTTLHFTQSVSIAKLLVEECHLNPEEENALGASPLSVALSSNNHCLALYYVDWLGKEINYDFKRLFQTFLNGGTVCHEILVGLLNRAIAGQIDLKGIENLRDTGQRTLLHRACIQRNAALVKALLEWGLDASVEDRYQRTPLVLWSHCPKAEFHRMIEAGSFTSIHSNSGKRIYNNVPKKRRRVLRIVGLRYFILGATLPGGYLSELPTDLIRYMCLNLAG
jgi:ankyrin repeat protein